jgi:DNA-binding MarR family transcriptional regulator
MHITIFKTRPPRRTVMEYADADTLNSAIRAMAIRHRARAMELLAPLALHPGQEFLLMELAERGPRIQAQLAVALGCEPPSVTHMVRKLVAGGFVHASQSSEDKRAVVVELTDAGRELSERVRAVWITLADDTVGDLPETKVRELAHILGSMAGNLAGRSRAGRPQTRPASSTPAAQHFGSTTTRSTS